MLPFLYAYEGHGRTYVGCMQKVFAVEIDLDLLEAAERGGASARCAPSGSRCRCARRSRARTSREDDLGCVNPEFLELPDGQPNFRIFAQITPNA